MNLPRIFLISWVFYLSIQNRNFPLSAIKLVQNLSELHQEEPERFLLRCSGFYIVKLEHVYEWVAVSTSDNDQVKASGKEIDI